MMKHVEVVEISKSEQMRQDKGDVVVAETYRRTLCFYPSACATEVCWSPWLLVWSSSCCWGLQLGCCCGPPSSPSYCCWHTVCVTAVRPCGGGSRELCPSETFKLLTENLYVCAGMWYCSTELSQLRHRPGSDVAIVEVGLQTDLHVYLHLTQTWIILCKSVNLCEISQEVIRAQILTVWYLCS